MAASIAAVGAVTSSGQVQTIATSAPSGVVAGSPLLLAVSVRHSTDTSLAPGTPSGWTLAGSANVGNATRVYVYRRYAVGDATDTPTVDLGATASQGMQAVILRLAGADATTLLHATNTGSGSSATAAIPTASVGSSGSLALSFGVIASGGSAVTASWPSPWAEQVDSWISGVVRHTLTVAEAAASPSTSPGGDVTFSASGAFGFVTVVVNPAPSDTDPPTLSGFAVPAAGTTLTATLSESECVPASGTGGFTLSGTSAAVSSWAISGTTLTLTLSEAVLSGETVTISYDRDATTDDIADAAGNFLANISGASVTNDSTQTPPLTPITPGVIAFVSSGPAAIVVAEADAPADGEGTIARQWQRSVDGGSYADVSGATSPTLTDTGVATGEAYRYRLRYTDSESQTADSNLVGPIYVYEGGSIEGGGGTRPSMFSSPIIRGAI
jgi:hypothetical protein